MSTAKDCPCPKTGCQNHKNCYNCILKHNATDSLPFCIFPDNDGDKSIANYYRKLKARFENA